MRIEAAPVNPSDLALLLATADWKQTCLRGSGAAAVVSAPLGPKAMKALAPRLDIPLVAGNEGAGVVIATGTSEAARALLGKTVAVLGGAMYVQYRAVPANQCLVLPEDVTVAQGAGCFVNPLTALGMVGTMRDESHQALVHTAAASNLGQMLNKLCLEEKIALVNIVRTGAQEDLLRSAGALHVCRSDAPDFLQQLTAALAATGATLGFDAIGGGAVAGQILGCMEAALNQRAAAYSRYGSSTHKQVYIYGSLDPGPAQLSRNYGMAWGLGGWLLTPYLHKIGPQAIEAMKMRVLAGLKTTFASHYAREISLTEALQPEVIASYGQRATGLKYLINPQK